MVLTGLAFCIITGLIFYLGMAHGALLERGVRSFWLSVFFGGLLGILNFLCWITYRYL